MARKKNGRSVSQGEPPAPANVSTKASVPKEKDIATSATDPSSAIQGTQSQSRRSERKREWWKRRKGRSPKDKTPSEEGKEASTPDEGAKEKAAAVKRSSITDLSLSHAQDDEEKKKREKKNKKGKVTEIKKEDHTHTHAPGEATKPKPKDSQPVETTPAPTSAAAESTISTPIAAITSSAQTTDTDEDQRSKTMKEKVPSPAKVSVTVTSPSPHGVTSVPVVSSSPAKEKVFVDIRDVTKSMEGLFLIEDERQRALAFSICYELYTSVHHVARKETDIQLWLGLTPLTWKAVLKKREDTKPTPGLVLLVIALPGLTEEIMKNAIQSMWVPCINELAKWHPEQL